MVVVALLSVDLVESVDLVSVYLVVNCNDFKASVHKISFSFNKIYKASLNFVKNKNVPNFLKTVSNVLSYLGTYSAMPY